MKTVIRLLLGFALITIPSVARASSFSLSGSVSVRYIPDSGGVTGSVALTGDLTSLFQGTAAKAGPFSGIATTTNTANGLPTTATYVGDFNGAGPTAGTPVHLGALASIDVTNFAPGLYQVDTHSLFVDVLDVTGLPVGTNFLEFVFTLDGKNSSAGGGRAFDQVFVTVADQFGGEVGVNTLVGNVLTSDVTYFKAAGDTQALMSFNLRAFADSAGSGPSGTVGARLTDESDFLHTLTLLSADAVGTGGVRSALRDTDGLVYNSDAAPSAVPEPATMLLLLPPLAIGAVRRFKSSR